MATPISEISIENSDLYFLFRNGLGESKNALNETLYDSGKIAEEQVNSLMEGIYTCVGLIGIVCLLCTVFLIPKILQVQKQASIIWRTIFSVPLATLVELKRKSLDRLKIYHSVEIDSEEPRNLQRKDKKKRLNDPVWRTLLALMLTFAGLTFGFYAFIFYVGVKQTADLLLSRTHRIEIIYAHQFSMHTVLHWSAEILGEFASNYSMYNLEPKWQLFTTPQLEFESAYNLSKRARKRLMDSFIDAYIPIYQTTETLMFVSIESEIVEMHKGLLAAEMDYLETLKRFANGEFDIEYIKVILLERAMHDVIDRSAIDMTENIDQEIHNMARKTLIMFALYLVTSLSFYLFITLPILKWVFYRIKQAWRITSLIPYEVMHSVLRREKQR